MGPRDCSQLIGVVRLGGARPADSPPPWHPALKARTIALTSRHAAGLSPIAAPIDKAPTEPFCGAIRVDGAAATVLSGLAASSGGGDFGERLVERACTFFGREPTRASSAGFVPPAHLPATPVKADAHAGLRRLSSTSTVLPDGRTEWTYLPRGNSTSNAGRNRGEAPTIKKAPLCGAFVVRPRGLEPPRTIKSTRPSTLRVYQFRHRRWKGGQYSPGPECPGGPGRSAQWSRRVSIESVLEPRYSAEHMFDCLRIAELNEQGAD